MDEVEWLPLSRRRIVEPEWHPFVKLVAASWRFANPRALALAYKRIENDRFTKNTYCCVVLVPYCPNAGKKSNDDLSRSGERGEEFLIF